MIDIIRGQEFEHLGIFPNGWIADTPPGAKGEKLGPNCKSSLANRSRHIVLSVVGGQVVAHKPLTKRGSFDDSIKTLAVDSGELTVVDNGEFELFGNSGCWHRSFISQNNARILDKNCSGLYKLGERIFVLSGTAHMCSDEGMLFEIFSNHVLRRWEVKQAIDLGSCPQIYTVHEDKAYIFLGKALIAVDADGKVETLADDWYCGSYYPNCMVYNAGKLFTGMRGGVHVFDLESKTSTWYNFLDESTEI